MINDLLKLLEILFIYEKPIIRIKPIFNFNENKFNINTIGEEIKVNVKELDFTFQDGTIFVPISNQIILIYSGYYNNEFIYIPKNMIYGTVEENNNEYTQN